MNRTLGKYVLGAQIAAGGMAEIHHATYRGAGNFEKEICIKLIRSQSSRDPEFRRMFENEAVIAAKLQHANIVQVFDYDRDGDDFFIAMEYVYGKDLRTALNRAATLGEPPGCALAVNICLGAATGLGIAHRFCGPGGQQNPVIHRDVSPHNILLSFAGEVKIADFGIARLKSAPSFTSDGVLKGKVSYMSPEQAAGTPVDARSDVFSLGIVLWEMLTGLRLFEGDSEMEIMKKVREAVVMPPSSARRLVPKDLDEVVMTALENRPDDRYRDGEEMAAALKKFLYGYTHDGNEESVAQFLARLYPDEKRPALREHTEMLPPDAAVVPATPAPGPVVAAPTETTEETPLTATRRRAPIYIGAAAAAALIALGAFVYNSNQASPPVTPPTTPAPAAPAAPKRAAAVCAPTAADSCADPTPAAAAPTVAAPSTPDVPKKTPAAQVKATAKTGRLTLNANPWADVYLKGKKIGTTPLTGHPLPEGTHTIVLKNPELSAQKEITVRIAADELTTVPVDLMGR